MAIPFAEVEKPIAAMKALWAGLLLPECWRHSDSADEEFHLKVANSDL